MKSTLEAVAAELKQLGEEFPLNLLLTDTSKIAPRDRGLHRREIEVLGKSVRIQFSKTVLVTRILPHLSIALLPPPGLPDNNICEVICRAFYEEPPVEMPSITGNCRQFVWPTP